MRIMIFALAMGVLAAMPVRAQDRTLLPEITVTPPAPKDTDHKGTDDKGGADKKNSDDHSFNDLNQQLKRKVDEVNPIGNNPPLDAGSPDIKTGVVSIPGVQQQYGKNFGNSATPFRPATPVFSSPLGGRR